MHFSFVYFSSCCLWYSKWLSFTLEPYPGRSTWFYIGKCLILDSAETNGARLKTDCSLFVASGSIVKWQVKVSGIDTFCQHLIYFLHIKRLFGLDRSHTLQLNVYQSILLLSLLYFHIYVPENKQKNMELWYTVNAQKTDLNFPSSYAKQCDC